MIVLTAIWIVVLGLIFWLTNQDQRESALLVMWGIMALFVIYEAGRLLLSWLA